MTLRPTHRPSTYVTFARSKTAFNCKCYERIDLQRVHKTIVNFAFYTSNGRAKRFANFVNLYCFRATHTLAAVRNRKRVELVLTVRSCFSLNDIWYLIDLHRVLSKKKSSTLTFRRNCTVQNRGVQVEDRLRTRQNREETRFQKHSLNSIETYFNSNYQSLSSSKRWDFTASPPSGRLKKILLKVFRSVFVQRETHSFRKVLKLYKYPMLNR